MQVTCSCGKKLFFGEDPDEEQVCNFCGQTVRASGPASPAGRPTPKRRASGERRAVAPHETGEIRKPPDRPKISTRARLFIAGERGRGKGCGCLVALLLLVGAGVLAADYFMKPPGLLTCGHEGKASYAFGVVPFGHGCEGLKALEYLDRARRAIASSTGRPTDFESVKSLPGVGEPAEDAPYKFGMFGDGTLAADPKDGKPGLYHYLVEPDGTVRYEKDEVATLESDESGSLAP
ncbi:MAG: hypothetical protein ACYTFI_27195 [Planctomycetota bacterium]|jgi:hypothetical protein